MKTLLRFLGIVVIIIAIILFSPDINPTGNNGTAVSIILLFLGSGLCYVSGSIEKTTV